MSNTDPQTLADFREAFEKSMEATVFKLVTAVAGTKEVLCGPLDATGMAGWQFEAKNPAYSLAMRGDLEYGKAYLRQMINQGFRVSFAVWCSNGRALVCFKTWEPDEDEPSWPRDTDEAELWQHESPQFSN